MFSLDPGLVTSDNPYCFVTVSTPNLPDVISTYEIFYGDTLSTCICTTDTLFYTFNGILGKVFVFTSQCAVDIQLNLYGPNGNYITTSVNSLTYIPQETGLYIIAVFLDSE